MLLQSYHFRLKTASETFTEQNHLSNSDSLLIYFKGDKGFTQSLLIPLGTLNEEIYEKQVELLDVGNLLLVHAKLNANNDVRWKLNWMELENGDKNNKEKSSFNFPIYRWLDSNHTKELDVFIREGPAQFAPIYTIIVHTGSISSCSKANVRLALIGDGASTLPFDLNTKSNGLISCSTNVFYISSWESVDIGQLFQVKLQCDCNDNLPYYCESIEVINHSTDIQYFFLVNHWFGPNLEQHVTVPVIDRSKELNVFTISIKTKDISNLMGQNIIHIHIDFTNGSSHEEMLSSSETHQIPFQKDNTDFFMIFLNNNHNTEINTVKIAFISKSAAEVQWTCAWIEIRDVFYQRHYCYMIRQTLTSSVSNDYIYLERITDLPCSRNFA